MIAINEELRQQEVEFLSSAIRFYRVAGRGKAWALADQMERDGVSKEHLQEMLSYVLVELPTKH